MLKVSKSIPVTSLLNLSCYVVGKMMCGNSASKILHENLGRTCLIRNKRRNTLPIFTLPVFVRFLAVGSQHVYCAVSKKENYDRAYALSLQIYLQLWLRVRGETPLRTRVIRYLQNGIRC